ncbi:MAG: hypothetical protein Q9190_004502 [Brigantiaea leucoxantha]
MGDTQKPYVPARTLNTEFPLIDSDPYVSWLSINPHFIKYETDISRESFGTPDGLIMELELPLLQLDQD